MGKLVLEAITGSFLYFITDSEKCNRLVPKKNKVSKMKKTGPVRFFAKCRWVLGFGYILEGVNPYFQSSAVLEIPGGNHALLENIEVETQSHFM